MTIKEIPTIEIPILFGDKRTKWYHEVYCKSDYWRYLRKKMIKESNHKCSNPSCNWTYCLQLHHIRYTDELGSVLGRETNKDIKVLCRWCHEEAHGIKEDPNKKEDKTIYKKSCVCCGKMTNARWIYCFTCGKEIARSLRTVCKCGHKKPEDALCCYECDLFIEEFGITEWTLDIEEKRKEKEKKKLSRKAEKEKKREEEHQLLMSLNPEYAKQFQTRDISYNREEDLEFLSYAENRARWAKMSTEELHEEAEEELILLEQNQKKLLQMIKDFNNSH